MGMSEGLTFDMIGNVSETEIEENQSTTIEDTSEIEFSTLGEAGDTPELDDETTEDTIPENVDGEHQEQVEESSSKDTDSPNFYSSIATSLHKDGILNLLDDTDFKEVTDATSFAAVFQKQIDSMLDAQQQRINEALNSNVPVDAVKQFEQTISYLEGIDQSTIESESEEAEQLRGNIIVQDYMNKGFSQERANKEAAKSFDAGTDIEDAIDSLKDVKKFYNEGYKKVLTESKEAKQNKLKEEKKQLQELEDKFLKTEEPIKGIKLTPLERKKMYKQFTDFVDKDASGKPLNAIQKYAKDNPSDYQYALNTLYYLTDGFQNLGKVVGKEVKNKTKSALSELEKTLRNPANNFGTGGLDFGNDKSSESFKGFTVALD